MPNLFSIFDPIISNLALNWLSSLCVIIVLPNLFWLIKNQWLTFLNIIKIFVTQEFSAITGYFFTPGGLLISLSLFIFIALNNFIGLFPYIFTASRHLTFTVTLALPLWLGHILFAWIKTPKSSLAHLVPLGTPIALAPFITLIECIRNIIRPLTLSVRLTANIVAGHLLLTLISSQIPSIIYSIFILPLIGLILLIVLERAVAIIQAYVFRVLSTLYINEVNSLKLST